MRNYSLVDGIEYYHTTVYAKEYISRNKNIRKFVMDAISITVQSASMVVTFIK